MSKKGEIILRKPLRWFAEKMELVLRKNDFKQHNTRNTVGYLFLRLSMERDELLIELEKTTESNNDKIIHECCDVADFAMMIANMHREE